MMVKELFDEVEEYLFGIKLFTHGVSKEDVTTQDGRVLSQKQANCLYNYFDLNFNQTLKYIQNNNYDEISKTIGKALEELKENKEWM